ncbi:MAG TPA: bacillithiol biosynthesis BshC [Thermoanaerobaculia bacterium]|nr:bacillithiol biosynthesis BshC [Thermoanaerobaculia bacterium]
MLSGTIPFERYPGLPPLFLDFLRGLPDFYPDPPSIEAAAARGRELLGQRPRLPAEAFRARVPQARAMAEELAAGRAVAVLAGHQVGLFTGPLFTVTKAFDAIRLARDLTRRGVPAVPVFWALTDDHDLDEIARTARPGKSEVLFTMLEGADRSNRQPVGGLPLPEKVTEVLEGFRDDIKAPDGAEILEAFASRYRPGNSYGEAFIEMLFDLVEDEPLLILDPSSEPLRRQSAEFFAAAAAKEAEVRETLRSATEKIERSGRTPTVAFRPEVFPFFTVEEGERRRVSDISAAARAASSGAAWISTDVLSRPVFKSFLMPCAASVLGASEIAYHAQSLPLYSVFGTREPVLLPRSHLVLLGPPERRAAEALGIAPEDLLQPIPPLEAPSIPEVEHLRRTTDEIQTGLASLDPGLSRLDPTLSGALENARKKVSHQLDQLMERIRKAAERKDETTSGRRSRLEVMLLPLGAPAERIYPPLVPMLAYGREALATIREAAAGSLEGAGIVNMGADRPAEKESVHAG